MFVETPEREGFMEMKFLADSMLGRLAKWLRVMGYDTHYQPFYHKDAIERLVRQRRTLLSRHKKTADRFPDALFIRSNRVADQINELKNRMDLRPDRSRWFTRCLICNAALEKAHFEVARENVPEYVLYENAAGIRFCPSCDRYFWPGSHREGMLRQLKEWGF